ncbi:hypothetical protein CEXT_434141 [Caerostris extrusa]|uniref:Uncharacterized protein n=1 Tax=Caerostris extrusa TaxID=172846 RepID=A0AAV4YA25_CAEEX|nr:hypothetical protein CEXT_434141 [Caerostris extrusa]
MEWEVKWKGTEWRECVPPKFLQNKKKSSSLQQPNFSDLTSTEANASRVNDIQRTTVSKDGRATAERV